MNNQQLKVFFPSLSETFSLSPLFDPDDNQMYWIEDEQEQLRWYAITGFPTCCMIKRKQQMFCHSSWEVKIGEIV
jgi:hypothetical protein